MYLMYIFISVPSVISHSFLSIIVVIVHEKYTLLDQRDRYNCLECQCVIWIYPPTNTDDLMVYAHPWFYFRKDTQNMLYSGLECR